MSANLSVLERNVIHSLGAYDCAAECEALFLKRLDADGLETAERKANRWGIFERKLTPMLDAASRPFGGSDHGVRDFIRTRLEHMQ